MTTPQRCPWAGPDPIYIDYHDQEWGRPLYDSRRLYELLVLEGMQAGLSWITVLKKREAFRRAFRNFDPEQVARYGEADLEALLQNPAIIRHRGKLTAAVENARAFLRLQEARGSFAGFPSSTTPPPWRTSRPPRRSRKPSAGISRSGASALWAPPLSMPSCKPPDWWTTTWSGVPGTRRTGGRIPLAIRWKLW